MFLSVGWIAVMIMHIQIVQSTSDLGAKIKTIIPYQCFQPLRLRCTYTGNTSTCCSLTREWRVNNVLVMTNGNVASTVQAGKYAEGKVDHSGNYFQLIINNLQEDDLEKSYSCTYSFDQLDTAVTTEEDCICLLCCIEGLSWATLGTAICAIIGTILLIYYAVRQKGRKKTAINRNGNESSDSTPEENQDMRKMVAGSIGVYIIISFFPNIVTAGLAGTYEKFFGYPMIAVGIGSGLFGIAAAYFIFHIQIFTRDVFGRLLILTAVEALVMGFVVFAVIGNFLKGLCGRCGGRSYGWSVISTVIILIIFIVILRFKKMLTVRKVLFVCLIALRSLVISIVVAVPFGIYLCPCNDMTDPLFIIFGAIYSLILLYVFWNLFDTDEDILLIVLLTFGGIMIIFPILLCVVFLGKKMIKANVGDKLVTLQCPLTTDFKKENSAWFKNKKEVAKGTGQGSDSKFKIRETGDLCITNVQKEDAGIYECASSGIFGTGAILKLSVTSGNSQSVESGSSCWPICRVGQDPNTSSSNPEKVRRSPEKERADKKKERKPTEVVRPQPHRALPPMTQHLGTENTRRAEFSTETEMYKPRPLPSISGQSDSPRPLPKRTPDDLEKSSVQLKPLGDSISEKKKKKKRKKKETKQSDEED